MKNSDNTNNTILITGGATGVGSALAVRFLKQGNEVIIRGWRQEKLKEAKRKYPRLHTCRCDLSDEFERVQLFKTITRDFPKLKILLNNAGISDFHKLDSAASWPEEHHMIATNLEGTIHLSQLFVSHLSKQNAPPRNFCDHFRIGTRAACKFSYLLRDENRSSLICAVIKTSAKGFENRSYLNLPAARGHRPWRAGAK